MSEFIDKKDQPDVRQSTEEGLSELKKTVLESTNSETKKEQPDPQDDIYERLLRMKRDLDLLFGEEEKKGEDNEEENQSE